MFGTGASFFPAWATRAAGGPPPSTLLNGLVSYWPLDELSGTRADAVVASGNDLTDNNTVGYSLAGPSGTVASFAKANTESLSSTSADFNFSGNVSFSVAGWVKCAESQNGFFGKWAGGDWGWAMLTDGTSPRPIWRVEYAAGGGYTEVRAPVGTSVGDGAWHFVVCWHDADADEIGISFDGSAATAAHTQGVGTTTSPFELGGNLGAGVLLEGQIGRAAVWSRAISSGDRTSLFNSGSGKSYADLTAAEKVGLVSYWNLDEPSGVRYDSHGANDLTDNNTVGSATAVAGAMHNAAASFVAANSESLGVGSLLGSSPKTYSLWVKSDGGANTKRVAVDKGMYLDVYHDSGANLKVDAYYYDGATYPLATTGWVTKALGWLNIVTDVTNGGIANVYVNGDEFTGTVAFPGNEGTQSNFTLTTNNGTLLMDEVGLWSRVLTSDERTELWNAGKGKFYDFS